MKKLFIILFMVVSLVMAGNAFACEGGNCSQVDTAADANSDLIPNTYLKNSDSTEIIGGGAYVGNVNFNASSEAYGQDTVVFDGYEYTGGQDGDSGYYEKIHGFLAGWVKKFRSHPYPKSEWVFLGTDKVATYKTESGTGEAEAETILTLTTDVTSNFLRNDSQVQELVVGSETTLGIDGWASAEGNYPCFQDARISINGSVGADVFGNTKVVGVNGSYAAAGAGGLTEVTFAGNESDHARSDAYVDFHSDLSVAHDVYSKSFVSADGTIASNLAISTGGSAQLNRGLDGQLIVPLGYDNIDLIGITAKGSALQAGQAVGFGGVAHGTSEAAFNGAVGSVASIPGDYIFCYQLPSPGMTATVGGMAKAYGYNRVISSGNSITVISHQVGYATTGNSGSVVD